LLQKALLNQEINQINVIRMYLLTSNEKSGTNIYELSDEQMNAVQEGQLQYWNGQFLTEDQADKDIEEWLGK